MEAHELWVMSVEKRQNVNVDNEWGLTDRIVKIYVNLEIFNEFFLWLFSDLEVIIGRNWGILKILIIPKKCTTEKFSKINKIEC